MSISICSLRYFSVSPPTSRGYLGPRFFYFPHRARLLVTRAARVRITQKYSRADKAAGSLIRKLIERRGTLVGPLTSKLLTTTTATTTTTTATTHRHRHRHYATVPGARPRAEGRKLYRFLSQLVAVLIAGNCRHFAQKAFHFRRSPLSGSLRFPARAIDVTYLSRTRIVLKRYRHFSGNIALH